MSESLEIKTAGAYFPEERWLEVMAEFASVVCTGGTLSDDELNALRELRTMAYEASDADEEDFDSALKKSGLKHLI